MSPPPNATTRTRSPAANRPCAFASASAIGMEAAEVFPYFSRLTKTRSSGIAEPLPDDLNDAQVRLVRDEQLHVVDAHPAPVQRLAGDLDHLQDGVLERLIPHHPDGTEPLFHHLGGVRMQRAAPRALDQLPEIAVGVQVAAEDPLPFRAFGENHRPRAVAEEDAGGPVGVIGHGGEDLRSDHEGLLPPARPDESVGHRQGVDEPRTGGGEVHAVGARRPDLRLEEARGGRERHVRRQRPDDHDVEVRRVDARVIERFPGRLDAHVGIPRPRLRDVACADPGALRDPRVVRVDHLFEVGIGQFLRRGVHPQPDDFRCQRFSSPWDRLTVSPARSRRRVPAPRWTGRSRRPPRSARGIRRPGSRS